MNRLSRATLATLPSEIASPLGRPTPRTGIVHFGASAFHRAHQAAYIDALLAEDPRWGIAAVSLRSSNIVDTLTAQDGLYTLAVRDVESSMRVIDAHTRLLGPGDGVATRAALTDPRVALVTMTVTEKGYCLAPDGTLDFNHPDIAHDLAASAAPRSVIGWIVAGLAARREARVAPFVPMPCDNLAANGEKLKAALLAFAQARDPGLVDWIAGEVRVPSTMVDSITPASDEALYADAAATLGVRDDAAVQREAFTQWVIEDIGPIGPDLAAAGATVTGDVAGYEKAKLRILNGAHSTLAYAGLLRGHSSVADAMADPALAAFVEAMIAQDITPMLPPIPGLDVASYAAAVLQRFRNPVIVHRLDQIAIDGSQKLPYRLGDTLIANRRIGRMPRRVVAAFGCWVAFLMRCERDGVAILDPASDALSAASSAPDASIVIDRLLESGLGPPAEARADSALLAALKDAAGRAFHGEIPLFDAA